jgi:glycerol-3-phosphate dehydrogenase subunit C
MTPVDDPNHDLYLDEAATRGEMARVFDVCNSCRRCVDLCSSFPTLFEMLDRFDDHAAGNMTPAQQDVVVDACFQCTLCSVGCPHGPGTDDAVDMPRLMLRATAMQLDNGHRGTRDKITAQFLGRADLVGRLNTRTAAAANKVVEAPAGSWLRRLHSRLTGITATRRLPTYATERFSTWFARRPRITMQKKQASVTLFPTCLVEYQATDVGKDLVKVYERNGIECGVSNAKCCGAPWLHAGEIDRFAKLAAHNVATLADEVRSGTPIVVPQPTCSHVVKHHYAEHVPESSRADAELVAAHTYDAAEYLMMLHRGDDYVLDTDFTGSVPRTITYHAPSHLRSQETGLTSRDLMRLTGARIAVIQQSAGIESLWGYRAADDTIASDQARRFIGAVDRVHAQQSGAVAGDCHLANTVIAEHTELVAVHPIQIIARAYGIPGSS